MRTMKSEVAITHKPPSHAPENNADHRAFLKRSLERSDKELAVLQTLNRQLQKQRNAIVENYGESSLLDIGEGLVYIDEATGELITPSKNDNGLGDKQAQFAVAAKDFILRFKLRRKILNRLARRLLRLNHIMDGRITKANPPAVPKYGEVRLLSSSKQFKDELGKLKADIDLKEQVKNQMGAMKKEFGDRHDDLMIDPQFQKLLSTFTEYDEEYDRKQIKHIPTFTAKVVPAVTKEDLQGIEKGPDDFDYDSDEYKDNIGATIRHMNNKEKAMESKRYQTELLSKLPDQPTFKDLGMNNNIFNLEERKKATSTTVKTEEVPMKEEDKTDVVMSSLDVGKDTITPENVKSDVKSEEGEDISKDKKGAEDEENKEENSEQKENNESPAEFVMQKPFSLDPVPSFHDQDYARILTIHSDLISNSVQETSRKAAEKANAEYQKAFQASSQCQNRKILLENEQKQLLHTFSAKSQLSERNRILAYQKWQNQKKQFDAQQLGLKQLEFQSQGRKFTVDQTRAIQMNETDIVTRALSGAVDRVVIRTARKELAFGTQYTQSRVNSRDPITSQVSTSLAHCVDSVIKRTEERWVPASAIDEMRKREFPPFKFDKPADTIIVNEKGETFSKANERIGNMLKQVNQQLVQCEQTRAAKWQNFMKAKQEYESQSRNSQRARSTGNVYTMQQQHAAMNYGRYQNAMNYGR